jgi:anti-sigma B factor antagonist
MAPLEITIARSKDSVELAVGGDIDLKTFERFNRVLRDAVYETHQTVNLDLSQVTFICSVGIGSLVSARQLAVEEGVILRIVKASDKVELVLDVMALGDYFL